ncbi:Txe/YoeB family addiction module toxin [Mobiluncus curtisii]|uniref:Endoribonuclease YoeB n=1 Tax=Mobiluncus holmesii ATCC 35242 TaxID=887899 RepID=E6M4D8_9ACTO|nr:Txe/YoeB family addiction module toxin [Mobiluncus curtisii]EFU81905.1 addiction module toxin, Txe/YoeB family [Mobiluncus holmesii ATCC 35242]
MKDTQRDPISGLGKSEPLKGELSGCFSRRIDEKNRLVYRLRGDTLEILQCRGHYQD